MIILFSFNVNNNLIGRIILTHYNGSTSDSFFNDRNNETALSNDHSTNVNASLLRAGIREALSKVTDTTFSTSVNIVLHAAVSIQKQKRACIAYMESTVVKISIPPPSFKPVPLCLSLK